MNSIAYLLTGTNQGDRRKALHEAIIRLGDNDIKVIRSSSIYETEAWGKTDQGAFLNQVIEVETTLSPGALLKTILKIELAMGRRRIEKWGPRLIDIDILFYNHEIVEETELLIPHPELHKRMFTLIPLHDLIPDYIHPKLKKTVKKLLAECEDDLRVTRR